MSLARGTRLGPFEVDGLLGAGGMAEVYRAHDVRLGREVAIKILPDLLSADPDALARFEREARTASSLNHPHIITIHGVGEAYVGGRLLHFMAMELIRGNTLREHLATDPRDGRTVDARNLSAQGDGDREQGSSQEENTSHGILYEMQMQMQHEGTKVRRYEAMKLTRPIDLSSCLRVFVARSRRW